jgi:hypothetical protein
MLRGPQSRSGLGDEEKNSQPPPEIEIWNPERPARSLVAISSEHETEGLLYFFLNNQDIDFMVQNLLKIDTSVIP